MSGEVKEKILEFLKEHARARGRELPPLTEATRLVEDGLLDSRNVVALLVSLEEAFSVVILDAADFDVEEVVTLEGLIRAVERRRPAAAKTG